MNSKKKLFDFYKDSLTRLSKGRGYGKKYPVKFLMKKTKSFLKPDFCEVLGHKMYLDKHDSLDLALNGIYNSLDTKIVMNEIKPGNIVIDIGAHIGYYTLIFAELVGDSGKVFSFEPESKNFELLTKNVDVNNFQNVTLEKKGVSDRNDTCTFYVGQQSSGANRIYEPKKTRKQNFNTTTIETVNLDSYFEKTQKIDFIKLDIEGAELKALSGMKSIIEYNDNLTIFTEYDPLAISDSGNKPSDIIDFLYEHNFQIYILDENKNDMILTDKKYFKSLDSKGKLFNLLCKKIES